MKSYNDKILPDYETALRSIERALLPDLAERNSSEFMRIAENCMVSNPALNGYILARNTALSSFSWEIVGVEIHEDIEKRLSKVISELLAYHSKSVLFGKDIYAVSWSLTEFGLMPKIENLRDFETNGNDVYGVGRYHNTSEMLIRYSENPIFA